MNRFQKVALAALLSVLLLMFVGAIVRATGAGMGCPDWPKCWGRYVPPTSIDQIDPESLPIEKFQKKAERYGRVVTRESVMAEFDPTHAWTEYINRLCSLPVGLFSVLTLGFAFARARSRPDLWVTALIAVVLIGINAVMGARIVYSGLKPGTITIHMALAMLLVFFQVYLVWAGGEKRWSFRWKSAAKPMRVLGCVTFVLLLLEGIMGSQVREMTDALQKSHGDAPRVEWVHELEQTVVYLVHRSFSWVILIVTIAFYVKSRRERTGGSFWTENLILGIVLAQMVLGLVLAQVGILRVVQVLHIGLSSILVTTFCFWLFAAFSNAEEKS